METILITGINGFLGSHLAKAIKNEYNIIGLENDTVDLFRIKDEEFKVYSSHDNYELIFLENEIFAIIHTATIFQTNNGHLLNLLDTNIIMPLSLLELANKYNCKLFLNTDSFFNSLDNSCSYLPEYTLSKKHILEWLKLVMGNCDLINMKIYHMYGLMDSQTKFVPTMLTRLKNNETVIKMTPGDQTRDFIYIDDVVSAYKTVIHSYQIVGPTNQEFNVGTGSSITIKEFVILAKELTKSTSDLKFGALPYRANEIMISNCDNAELKKMGWVVKYSTAKGILKVIDTVS